MNKQTIMAAVTIVALILAASADLLWLG